MDVRVHVILLKFNPGQPILVASNLEVERVSDLFDPRPFKGAR